MESRFRYLLVRLDGAHDYLTKPIDLAELLDVVSAALGARRP